MTTSTPTSDVVSNGARPEPRRGPGFRFPIAKWSFFSYCSLSYIFLLSPLVIVIGASLHRGTRYTVVKFPPEDISLYWFTADTHFSLGSLIPQLRSGGDGLSLGMLYWHSGCAGAWSEATCLSKALCHPYFGRRYRFRPS